MEQNFKSIHKDTQTQSTGLKGVILQVSVEVEETPSSHLSTVA